MASHCPQGPKLPVLPVSYKNLRNPSSVLQHIIAPQARQYIYLFMPHGLYPFSGACASIASMRDIFPRMRIAAASVSFRIPVIRQLIGWINTIPVESRFAKLSIW